MKKTTMKEYATMTKLAKKVGLLPYHAIGVYSYKGLHAPIDLSACAEDEVAILQTAVQQLSERVDDEWNRAVEHDIAGD